MIYGFGAHGADNLADKIESTRPLDGKFYEPVITMTGTNTVVHAVWWWKRA